MARYIDADFLIEQLQPAKNSERNKRDYSKSKSEMIEDFCTELRNTRTADVVEVVRCKDCDVPHNEWTGCPRLNGLIPPHNHYCACGTPKERGGEK